MSKLKWFKHYNTAHEGQLFGDLILTGRHEAALLAYIIMELISHFEDENRRGYASVPIDRLARAMNMKPSKIDRLLADISAVSRSDLVCETDEEQPRNRSFLMRNWLKYQETRGGKRSAKNEQKSGRSKKGEGRRENKELNNMSAPNGSDDTTTEYDLELIYQEYPRRRGQAEKGKGLERLKKIIKNQSDYELALAAVRGYKAHLIREKKINTEFVKMFSSFWDAQGDWKEFAAAPVDQAMITDELIKKAKGEL